MESLVLLFATCLLSTCMALQPATFRLTPKGIEAIIQGTFCI